MVVNLLLLDVHPVTVNQLYLSGNSCVCERESFHASFVCSGYQAYLQMLFHEARHHNPIARVFLQLLADARPRPVVGKPLQVIL